jgi:hypothetical protein
VPIAIGPQLAAQTWKIAALGDRGYDRDTEKELMMEVSTYAGLLNQQIVVPSPDADYIRVEKHFFIDCMLPSLRDIKVDEPWYLQAYPDVQKAIRTGIVPDPKSHYCRYGFYEHRMPYRIIVDEPWYVAEYPDIRAAIASRQFASGQAHFDMDGFREGRMPYPNFRLESVNGNSLYRQLRSVGGR